MIELIIPEPTPLLNKWQRMHHRDRTRVCQRFAWHVRAALGRKPGEPITECVIEVDRHESGILPDWDGLYGGLKPLLDCLVVPSKRNPHGLGIIVDDNPNVVLELKAKSFRCKRKEGKTVVRIIDRN